MIRRDGCKHAEFFIGLSSGLSWLAWAAGRPVVMISGFTHPTNEFETPYRVINYHACNSCWNDVRHLFDHKDFMYCPRHKDTPRQFECTRLITVEQVKAVVQRIPGFGAHAKQRRGPSTNDDTGVAGFLQLREPDRHESAFWSRHSQPRQAWPEGPMRRKTQTKGR
jgi:hypothetical protein